MEELIAQSKEYRQEVLELTTTDNLIYVNEQKQLTLESQKMPDELRSIERLHLESVNHFLKQERTEKLEQLNQW